MSFNMGKSESHSKSRQLTPDQIQAYFSNIDNITGGRLGNYAKNGTPAVDYHSLTPDQVQSMGGLGATRTNSARTARAQALHQIEADPTMTMEQRQRAKQLTDQQYANELDSIAKETGAQITNMASQENARKYAADVANSKLTAEDLARLAQIYFGGKGSQSDSSAHAWKIGGGFMSGSH